LPWGKLLAKPEAAYAGHEPGSVTASEARQSMHGLPQAFAMTQSMILLSNRYKQTYDEPRKPAWPDH
jgi:hypothetical protein